ncbi:glycosyl transferase [Actinobacteria bacterium IMCC26256]|nr:glycosyl transferase [Actinobacteria bacterium IMCC26256]
MSSDPRITFAIPFYSGVPYLRRAIESVREQSLQDWVCIVVDDAGAETDTEAAVASYGDTRIRYVRNQNNLGLAGNWNEALRISDTPLVTLLHSDDELMPGYGEAVIAAHVAHPNAVAVFTRASIIDTDSKPVFSFPDRIKRITESLKGSAATVSGEQGLNGLLRGQYIFCPTLCYRASRLEPDPFQARWRMVADLEFLASTLLRGGEFVGIPEELYAYRRHEESQTALLTATTERFDEEIEIYGELATHAEALGWSRAARTAKTKRIIRLHLMYRIIGDLLHRRLKPARSKRAALKRASHA